MPNKFLGLSSTVNDYAREQTLENIEDQLVSGTMLVNVVGLVDVSVNNLVDVSVNNLVDVSVNNVVDVATSQINQLNIQGGKNYIFRKAFEVLPVVGTEWATVSGTSFNSSFGLDIVGGTLQSVSFPTEYVFESVNLEIYAKNTAFASRFAVHITSNLTENIYAAFRYTGSVMNLEVIEPLGGISITVIQADWNIDRADGSGDLGVVNFELFQAYKITFNMTGMVEFLIFDRITSLWQPIHRLEIISSLSKWYGNEVYFKAGGEFQLSYFSMYTDNKRPENLNSLCGLPIALNKGNATIGTQRVVLSNEVYPEKYLSDYKLLYRSNYRNNVNGQDLYEANSGDAVNTINNYGSSYSFPTTLNRILRKSVRFMPYNGNRLLYVYDIGIPSIMTDGNDLKALDFIIGLENNLNSQQDRAYFHIIADEVVANQLIEVIIENRDLSDNPVSQNIQQNNFNIDKVPNFNFLFNQQKFAILTDDFEYLFCLVNNKTLIPVHKFISEFVQGIPRRTKKKRPFIEVVNTDNNAGNLVVEVIDMKIFVEGDNIINDSYYINHYNVFNTKTITTTAEPIFSLKNRDNLTHSNIHISKCDFFSSKLCRLDIRYYIDTAEATALPTSAFVNNWNSRYDITATTFVGGILLKTLLIQSGLNTIDLREYVDWKLFGYDGNFSEINIITFTAQNLEATTLVLDYNFNISEF